MARYLERQGLLMRDAENGYLTAEDMDADPESPFHQLLASSITYRIAIGPQQAAKYLPYKPYPTVAMIRWRLRWAM